MQTKPLFLGLALALSSASVFAATTPAAPTKPAASATQDAKAPAKQHKHHGDKAKAAKPAAAEASGK